MASAQKRKGPAGSPELSGPTIRLANGTSGVNCFFLFFLFDFFNFRFISCFFPYFSTVFFSYHRYIYSFFKFFSLLFCNISNLQRTCMYPRIWFTTFVAPVEHIPIYTRGPRDTSRKIRTSFVQHGARPDLTQFSSQTSRKQEKENSANLGFQLYETITP